LGGSKTEKNRIPEDFFFSCVFSGGIFLRNMVLERSQEFLFVFSFTGFFAGIPAESGGFLRPPDSCSRQ
jgi:hypothetical protein